MNETMRRPAGRQSEARAVGRQAARRPPDLWLWGALGSLGASLLLASLGKKHDALFVGQWAPTFLLLGIYDRIKARSSERIRV